MYRNKIILFRTMSLLAIALIVLSNDIFAQPYISGHTYYGRNNYIEYICGNYPLIISAPHAGTLSPAEIGDRSCGANDNDVNTYETVTAIRDSFFAKTGKYPHVIINHLKRIKLDPNREVNEATCGDATALISYNEYHAFIDSAKAIVLRDFGKGLYNDFHGHGHTIQRIEIGYVLTSDDLALPNINLDSAVYVNKSSVKYLAGIVPISFSQLIRGPKSVGNFFEDQGYPAVPSPSQTGPGTASYFNGGYSVETHGSKNGGTIDGIQFETNYSGIRDNDANRKAFAHAYAKVVDRYIQIYYFGAPDTTTIADSVISNGNGPWSSPSTWADGIPPSSTKNVLIRAGDIVTVDVNTAQCKDIWFGSNTSKLAMGDGAVLNVYGDFSLFSTSHNAFSSWTPGAKIRFTGSVNQFLIGWAASGFSTSFQEMIVDKPGMKVATFGNNMKFGLGDSLEIVNGTFELAGTDDIEGRSWNGTASAPAIIVRSGGIFNMVGGGGTSTGSYIRKGSNTGENDKKIGKMTVFGEVDFGTSNTSILTNLNGIDIENGGAVYFPLGLSTAAGSFNPGTITIKNGGLFKSSLSTAFWYTNTLTQNTVIINSRGEYYSSAGTTSLPQIFTINAGGVVRYYTTSPSTLPAGISTYEKLILTGTSAKSLGTNTTVNDTLVVQSTATLNLNGKTLTYGPNAILQYGYSGQTNPQTTTDAEFLASNGPRNVTIYNSGGVTLHAARNVPGSLSLIKGKFSLGSFNLTVGTSTGGSTSGYVVTNGIGGLVQNVGSGNVSFPVGFTDTYTPVVMTNSGSVDNFTVSVKNTFDNSPVTNKIVNKQWTITEGTPGGSTANVKLQWNTSDENSLFVRNNPIFIGRFNGTTWDDHSAVYTSLGGGVYTASAGGFTAFSPFGIGNEGALPVELSTFASNTNGRDVLLNWETKTEKNSNIFLIERSCIYGAVSLSWINIGSVKASYLSNSPKQYSYADKNLQVGKYQYRLKMIDNDGSFIYSNIIETDIALPMNFNLTQNYPNPFNPSTKIVYQLPVDARVLLEVYDISGQKVHELVNLEQSAGYYSVDFNSSSINKNISSGVYFYRLTAIDKNNKNNFFSIKKMILLK